LLMPCVRAPRAADPKIRIYDSGMKKYGVDAFAHCVHLVRCGARGAAGAPRPGLASEP
jgi:hypothetical protein